MSMFYTRINTITIYTWISRMNLLPNIVCSDTWLSSNRVNISSREPKMNNPGWSLWFKTANCMFSHPYKVREIGTKGVREKERESVCEREGWKECVRMWGVWRCHTLERERVRGCVHGCLWPSTTLSCNLYIHVLTFFIFSKDSSNWDSPEAVPLSSATASL